MENPWFIGKKCSTLEIKKYKSISDHQMTQSVKIGDLKFIQRLMNRIEEIPSDGDKIKSFSSDTELIELLFCAEDGVQTIQIIQHGFKTPSTGFNSKNEVEVNLYNDIDGLLLPDLNKIIPLVTNLELMLPGFSIAYTGSETQDKSPATVSFTVNKFLLRDKNGKEQTIEIRSGQMPPQPVKIEFNRKKLTILTYETKGLQRLYPDYFQVVSQ
jgi:hypothetical protein